MNEQPKETDHFREYYKNRLVVGTHYFNIEPIWHVSIYSMLFPNYWRDIGLTRFDVDTELIYIGQAKDITSDGRAGMYGDIAMDEPVFVLASDVTGDISSKILTRYSISRQFYNRIHKFRSTETD